MCNKPDPQVCARCGSISYCSKECQVADWKTHKLLCAHLKEFSTAPVKGMRRAILFPADSAKPKFVWVATVWSPSLGFEKSDAEKFIGDDKPTPKHHIMRQNDHRKRFLQHCIHLIWRDNFTLDGSLPNQSVVLAAGGKAAYGWRGPIIAIAKNGKHDDPACFDDITLHDFRDVVDFFLTYDGSKDGTYVKFLVEGTAKGVRVNCPGDMLNASSRHFQAVEVDTRHRVFTKNMRVDPDIPRMVGLPICILRYPPAMEWSADMAKVQNNSIKYLQLTVDDCWDSIWGWMPGVWFQDGGSALVVRSQAEDLLPEHLEVLCDFCENKIGLICKDAVENGDLERGKRLVRKAATKKSFLAYYESYRSRKAISDERWRHLVSPYDVSLPESKGPGVMVMYMD